MFEPLIRVLMCILNHARDVSLSYINILNLTITSYYVGDLRQYYLNDIRDTEHSRSGLVWQLDRMKYVNLNIGTFDVDLY